ncbi:Cop9 signalosome-interactor 1 [Nakaseomyces bracarensis]|uniref:Cop9 signalosome-interactor 1 n=1 Tax=Nakaseomyces bracarensis TaxID=273131 RepID=A0ABR4NY57_9SACH
MCNKHTEILIDSTVILDVNFQYEKLCLVKDFHSSRNAMLFLLLGTVIQDKILKIQYPLSVVLTGDPRTGRFIIDKEQVNKRLELINTIHPEYEILGVLVINEKLFDYSEVIRMLLIDYNQNLCGTTVLFSYATGDDFKDDTRSKIYQETHNQLNLKCNIIVNYNLDLQPIDFEIITFDVSIPSNANNAKSNELDNISVNEEIEYFDTKWAAIKSEVTRIISFLQTRSTVEKPLNPVILNKIAVIVHILRKGPTDDIEESMQKMENDIRLIQLSLEQWEIVNMKSK